MPAPAASLVEQVIRQAERQPAAPALLWHRDRVTYRELHQMTRAQHARLTRLGLPAQRPIAVVAAKSPDTIALILACLLDRRAVLLPSVDLPEATLRQVVASAGGGHVLSGESGGGLPPAEPADPHGAVADATFLLTTSGSTGLPKVVPLSARAIDRFIDWAVGQFGIGPGRTVLNYAPLNFDLCLLDVWTTLCRGGCVALVDQRHATAPAYLLSLLTSSNPHVVQGVPLLFCLLADAGQDERRAFGAVEHVVSTGDRMPPRCLEALPRLFPHARFYNLYGCTETNDSFLYEISDPVEAARTGVPIGRPLPGVSALVVGADGAVIDGAGVGELLVSTPFQTTGYLDAELNARRFVSHPGGLDERIYFRSGDRVRRQADGVVTLDGRIEFAVKVRGVQVNMQDVEHALTDHDDVLEAAVIAVPDAVAGHRLHAIVRCAPESQLSYLTLRQHCAARLNRNAIPSVIRIVTAELPKTATGKLDRSAIRRDEELKPD